MVTGPRPSESLRRAHADLLAHLDHLELMAGTLARAPAADRRALLARLVSSLERHVRPYAAWAETHLYPLVERRAGATACAPLRHEHRVVERWLDGLAGAAAAATPDVAAFTRRLDNLVGLLRAHLEAEQVVLQPLLDPATTVAHGRPEP